jgi:hypothetical protein
LQNEQVCRSGGERLYCEIHQPLIERLPEVEDNNWKIVVLSSDGPAERENGDEDQQEEAGSAEHGRDVMRCDSVAELESRK